MAAAKAPWKKANPKKRTGKHLSPAMKRKAKARAKAAGRPYPNLVDNMAVSSGRAKTKQPKSKTANRKRAKRQTAKRKVPKRKSANVNNVT